MSDRAGAIARSSSAVRPSLLLLRSATATEKVRCATEGTVVAGDGRQGRAQVGSVRWRAREQASRVRVATGQQRSKVTPFARSPSRAVL